MQLYFSPMSGSLAVRIALYEAGLQAEFIEVHRATKHMRDGDDYRQIHPLGLVPLLRLEDGEQLTEIAAILTFIAEASGMAPTSPRNRARLGRWLSFTASELHKALFFPLFDPTAPEAARAYACARGTQRMDWLATHLAGREWLEETFSVADAYLLTVLSWCIATPISLDRWPSLLAYLKRGLVRPPVARAMAEEKALFLAAQASGSPPFPEIGSRAP